MTERTISRRKLLSRATIGIGAALGAGWMVPGIAYILGPTGGRSGTTEWRPLGAADKVEIGVPSLFKTRVTRTSGWVTTEEDVAVYVYTEDGRDYVGLSNICTHLGCRVRWITEQQQYFCPCHVGIFAKDGSVVAGPPPRPLDRYGLRVADGVIQVQLEV